MSTSRSRGNRYALSALKSKRATIAAENVPLERQLRHRKELLVHVDATLRLLDPSISLELEPQQEIAAQAGEAVPAGGAWEIDLRRPAPGRRTATEHGGDRQCDHCGEIEAERASHGSGARGTGTFKCGASLGSTSRRCGPTSLTTRAAPEFPARGNPRAKLSDGPLRPPPHQGQRAGL